MPSSRRLAVLIALLAVALGVLVAQRTAHYWRPPEPEEPVVAIPLAVPGPEAEDDARRFEVDRGFDPDYTQEIPAEALQAVRVPGATGAAPAVGAQVRLDRSASAAAVFSEPDLDVAVSVLAPTLSG